MYNTDDVNFAVYYKDNRHDVYTHFNGTHYEYEYFIEGDNLRLEEVENKVYKR